MKGWNEENPLWSEMIGFGVDEATKMQVWSVYENGGPEAP